MDPAGKSFCIGGAKGFTKSKELLKAELDKCVCLCSNCHAEIEEALAWRPDDQIVLRLREIAAAWIPGEFSFSRKDWLKHYPGVIETDFPLFV